MSSHITTDQPQPIMLKFKKSPVGGIIGGAVKWKSNWEFLYRSVAYSFTLEVLLNNYKIGKFDGESNFVQLLIVYVFVGLPLFYTQIILGQYSQMGVLCYKNMLPIARGLPYTIIFLTIIHTIKYGIWLGDCMLYFLATFQKRLPWTFCPVNITHVDGNITECLDDKTLVNCEESCLKPNTLISSRYYFRVTYLGYTPSVNVEFSTIFPAVNRTVALFSAWVLIFLFVQVIFVRYKKILLIQVCFTCVVIVLLCTGTVSASGGKSGISFLFQDMWQSFGHTRPWSHAISKVILGLCIAQPFVMTSGAKFPPKQNITGMVICFALTGAIISTFCSLFYQSIIGMVAHKTKMDLSTTNAFVLRFEYMAFFITIPQGLGYLTLPQVWSMMYFSFCITVLLMNIISRIVTIASMAIDVHSYIAKYTKYLLAIYCIVALLMGLLLIGEKHYLIACYFISVVLNLMECFIVTYISIMIYGVYGVTNLSDDIQFLTGSPPTKFFKFTWYVLPIIMVYACYEEYVYNVQIKGGNLGIIYIINIVILICMLPIPILWIVEGIKHLKSRHLIGMFRSTDSWGPSDPEERHKRLSFNPRLQTRYHSRISNCTHHCFISYKGHRILHQEETRCRESFLAEFGDSGFTKKDDRKSGVKRSVALDVLDDERKLKL